MNDYILYLKDIEYLPDNFTGNYILNIPITKWCRDLSVEEILPLKETWSLIIQRSLITSITRDTIVYTLSKQVDNYNFIYDNGQNRISLCFERSPSGYVNAITGYFYKSTITCFTYQLWA